MCLICPASQHSHRLGFVPATKHTAKLYCGARVMSGFRQFLGVKAKQLYLSNLIKEKSEPVKRCDSEEALQTKVLPLRSLGMM